MMSSLEALDLSRWKLTVPVDSQGGFDGIAIDFYDLAGFRYKPYFYTGTDGGMVFSAPVEGATTPGSNKARTELREVSDDIETSWSLNPGGMMTATLSINRVPTRPDGTQARVVIGQVHGVVKELVRLYYDNGTVYFVNDMAGPDRAAHSYALLDSNGAAPDIDLGETFSYLVQARGNTVTVRVYADGMTYQATRTISSAWSHDTFYFKAGIYLGVNETGGSGDGEAEFYGLDFSHTPSQGKGGLVNVAVPKASVALDGTLQNDVLRGSPLADDLNGHDGDDLLNGNGGDDTLWGGNGADRLNGGSGLDVMYGSDGNDTYLVDDSGDTVIEFSHAGLGGTDTILSSVSYTLPDLVEILRLAGTGKINATGNADANTLVGNAGANVIDGGDGADTLVGGDGNDTYFVDGADQVIEYAKGGADLVIAAIDYTLPANVESVTLTGTALAATGNSHDNHLSGNGLINILYGLGGNDFIDGRGGADSMAGGTGDDTYVVDDHGDQVTELAGEGHDLVKASVSYVLPDNVNDLSLTGIKSLAATGNASNNVISGNTANNRINGGLGNDTLAGHGGADKFVFNTALSSHNNLDTISDFAPNRDQLVVENSVFTGLDAGALADVQFGTGSVALTADQRIVYDTTSGTLYFDADGTGTAAQIAFAHLLGAPALTFFDIVVI